MASFEFTLDDSMIGQSLSDVANPRQPSPPVHNFSGSNFKQHTAKSNARKADAVLEAARQTPAE